MIGIVSLRLGEPPHVNLAIPAEKLLAVKDELMKAGRVVSRRPRPWLGLYTMGEPGRVVVDGFNESGPARTAGFRRGDLIVGVNGVDVALAGGVLRAALAAPGRRYHRRHRRAATTAVQVISVRSIDRYRLYPSASVR